MDRRRELGKTDPVLRRDQELVHDFSRARPDDGRAQDLIFPADGEHLGESLGLGVGHAAIEVVPVVPENVIFHVSLPGLLFRRSEMGYLRVGVRHPRDPPIVRFGLEPGDENVANDDPRLIVGGVGESVGTGNVSTSEDVRLRRCEGEIDIHPAAIELHSGGFEPEVLHVRGPSGGDENRVDRELPPGSFRLDFDRGAAVLLLEADRFRSGRDPHPVALERLSNRFGRVEIIPRQKARKKLDETHRDSEPLRHLSELAADGTASENEHRLGLRAEPVEKRFIGVVGHSVEPRNRRNESAGPGGDDEIPCAKPRAVVNRDLVRRQELRFPEEDVDSEAFESLLRVVRRDAGAALAHASKNLLEAKGWLHR